MGDMFSPDSLLGWRTGHNSSFSTLVHIGKMGQCRLCDVGVMLSASLCGQYSLFPGLSYSVLAHFFLPDNQSQFAESFRNLTLGIIIQNSPIET